jgi:hypothetical protein
MLLSPLLTPLPGHQPGPSEYIQRNVLGISNSGFGIAAGLFAPPYLDFGYAAVLIVLGVGGYVSQSLYELARSRRPPWVGVYLFVVADLVLSVYGSLVNSFSVLWVPAIVFSMLWLSRTRDLQPGRRLAKRPSMTAIAVTVVVASFVGLASMTAYGAAGWLRGDVATIDGGPTNLGRPGTGATPDEQGPPSVDCR